MDDFILLFIYLSTIKYFQNAKTEIQEDTNNPSLFTQWFHRGSLRGNNFN